jgi:hypothetical protein
MGRSDRGRVWPTERAPEGVRGRFPSGARWFAVLFVTINAITQIVWFPAAPLWAFLIILLDVTIIYQLTARWES